MTLNDAIHLSAVTHARLAAELEEPQDAETDGTELILPLPQPVCPTAQLLSDDWRLDGDR